MRLHRILLRRIVLGLVAAWAVLSMLFALFNVTEDWMLDRLLALSARQGTTEEDIAELRESYMARRGLDEPLLDRYADWMGNLVTLQWGESFRTGEAVFPLVLDATVRTAMYVVPAVVLATALGLGVGLFVTLNDRPVRGGAATGLVYGLFGLPNFWLAGMVLTAASGVAIGFHHDPMDFNYIEPVQLPIVYEHVLPTALLTTTLLAAIVSYARAYSRQYAGADMTKLIRAKGGGRLDVARHVLRNAAIPLVSLVFAETLALLAISAIVLEAMFGIGGLGSLFYNSVYTRDFPVIMGAAVVVVAFGVLANVLQDLAYSVLDPRVDTSTR